MSEVVGVLDAPRAQAVADGKRDIVLIADVEDVVPVTRVIKRVRVDIFRFPAPNDLHLWQLLATIGVSDDILYSGSVLPPLF